MSYSFSYTGERAAVKRAVENDPQIPDSIKAIVRETVHDRLPEHSKEMNGVTVSGFGHVNDNDDSALGNVQNFFITPIKLTLAVLCVLCALCVMTSARAQTNAPPTLQSFPAQAITWLTSVNTNNTWAGTKFVLGVGADYENGQQWGNNIDAEVDINPSGAETAGGNAFALGARIRNTGIAGVVEMAEAKVGYCVNYYDLRVEPTLYAGYDNQYTAAVIEPQLSIRKLMTWNTFLGIYIGEPILIGRNAPHSQQWVPNVGMETGCTLGGIGPNGQAVRFKTRVSHRLTAFRHLVSPASF